MGIDEVMKKIEKSGKRRIHLEQEKWEEIRNWLIQNCYILVKPQNNPTIEDIIETVTFDANEMFVEENVKLQIEKWIFSDLGIAIYMIFQRKRLLVV